MALAIHQGQRLSQLELTVTRHQSKRLAKLLEAASSCKQVPMKRYLASGGNPDAVVAIKLDDYPYKVPLILVAANCQHHHGIHEGSLQLLLDAGADVEAFGYNMYGSDRRALHWACCSAALKLLLSRGADPMMQSHVDGMSALHMAAAHGQVEKCKMLLQASEGKALTLLATGQLAPLWFAVSEGQLAVVKLVYYEYGADLKGLNAEGQSLLHGAACGGAQVSHVSVLAFLLSEGLDVHVNAVQLNGHTPLSVAAAATTDSVKAVQLLLEHGADINQRVCNGHTVLTYAVERENLAVMEKLIDHSSALLGHTVTCKSTAGTTPLMVAVRLMARHRRSAECVQLLLAKGADVNAVDAAGETALMCAAAEIDSAELVQLLLQHGADATAASPSGLTPLLAAVVHSHLRTAQLLIDAGADVNALCRAALPRTGQLLRDQQAAVQQQADHISATEMDAFTEQMAAQFVEGMTQVLLMAADTPAAVKLLLAAGADVHHTTSAGSTCLHVAAEHNYPAPVLCLLIKAGVDMTAVNSAGQTAAQVAEERGHTLAAALLNRAAQGP
jgi:uncharacterized protein